MPFDAFPLELAFFLSSLTVLASLPTDPYFYPWHDGPPAYRISHGPYGTSRGINEPPIEGQVFSSFGQRNFSRSRGDPGYPLYRVTVPENWYQLEQRSRNPQPEFPAFGQPEFDSRRSPSQRRSSESFPGGNQRGHRNDNIGVYNNENSFSSHVNCEAANQKKESEQKMIINIRENIEPIFGSDAPGKLDERMNFEDSLRSLKTGAEGGIDSLAPRIVTPKRGRRPSQGATNTISTTEKTTRNHTTKGPKRPRPKPQGGEIIFPDVYSKKFVPRIAKCEKKSTFCEHLGEEYPSEYISQILKKEGAMFREFFGKDMIRDPNITERFNAPEENSLCPFRQEVVFPRAAQNKEDKWLFIINQDQYVQGVTVEICLSPESRCILTEGFPLGYTPYCKQKYIERRLVAIGEDGKPHSDSFRLPSCCSCVVKHEASARMGFMRTPGDAQSPPFPLP